MWVHVVLLQTVMSEVTASVWTEVAVAVVAVVVVLGACRDEALQSSHTVHE